MLPVVALTQVERKEWIGPWNRAFRRALTWAEVEFKQAASEMKDLDEAQLSRWLDGDGVFDPRRIVPLTRAYPGFAGHFLAFLADELGGWRELTEHGIAAAIVPWLMAGRARPARASLEAPRSREETRCDGESWRASA